MQHLKAKNVSLSENLYSERKKTQDLQKEIGFLEEKINKMQDERRALKERAQHGAPEHVECPRCSTGAPLVAAMSSGVLAKPVKETDLDTYLEIARGVDERMSGLLSFLDDLRSDPLRFRRFLLDGDVGDGSSTYGAPASEKKKKPRIISDVRVVPPQGAPYRDCDAPVDEGEKRVERSYPWNLVERSGRKGRNRGRNRIQSDGSGTTSGGAAIDTPAPARETRERSPLIDLGLVVCGGRP